MSVNTIIIWSNKYIGVWVELRWDKETATTTAETSVHQTNTQTEDIHYLTISKGVNSFGFVVPHWLKHPAVVVAAYLKICFPNVT